MRAGIDGRFEDFESEEAVRADEIEQDATLGAHFDEALVVVDVGDENADVRLEVGAAVVEGEAGADPAEAGLVAAGDGPAQFVQIHALRLGEVLGGAEAGDAGGAEDDEVVGAGGRRG